MRRYESLKIYIVIILTILSHKMLNVKSEGNQKSVSNLSPPLLPVIPSLPLGTITGNTVDCVNSRFYKIQRENPQLSPWLSDVQKTVEHLVDVRKKCDTQPNNRQRECITTWNRAAGVQFLRLGLSLFEQENPRGNNLDILNVFVNEFQRCW